MTTYINVLDSGSTNTLVVIEYEYCSYEYMHITRVNGICII